MITLGKNVFVIPAPGGMKSFALQQRVLPVAGRVASVFLQLIGGVGADVGKLLESDVLRVLPQALPYVGEIFANMPKGELEAITRELLADATCDKLPLFGSPAGDVFDAKLQGRTLDTWKLLWHAIEVWYPDFFALAGSLRATTGEKEKPSEESNISPTAIQDGA